MTTNWVRHYLGDICDILDRSRKPITKKDRIKGPYPYYGATGVLDYVEGFLFDEPLVLVGEDGAKWEAGESSAFAINGKCWVNNHAHVIRPHRYKVLDKWLIYYLYHSDLMPFITGLTVPKLNQGKLRRIPVPLPPLPEQERIVAILDEAFAAIATATANAEKNIANARELFESELDRVFFYNTNAWVKTTLEKCLCVQPRNGWSPPAAHHSDTGIPVLTLSSVTGFKFKGEMVKYTSASTDPERHYWVRNGDFLITRSNTPKLVGHVAIAHGIAEPTIYPDLIMRMCPDSSLLDTNFLYYQMRTTTVRIEITGRAKGANPTMKKLNKKSVQTLPVSLPPLEVQRKIAQHLRELSKEIESLEELFLNKVHTLSRLKQSILHKAFTGELTADPKSADRTLSEAGL